MTYEHITAFEDPRFQAMFKSYFLELGMQIHDWDGLFREMDRDGRQNEGFLALDGDKALGFIQFCPMELTGWFFTCQAGFVREFWVAPGERGKGVGSALLSLAEDRFRQLGAGLSILTTDTAEGFYLSRGYARSPAWRARNGDNVYTKELTHTP